MNKQNWLIVSACWVLALGAGMALGRFSTPAGTPGAGHARAAGTGLGTSASSRDGASNEGTGPSQPAGKPGTAGQNHGAGMGQAIAAENLSPLTLEELLQMDRDRQGGYSAFEAALTSQEIRRRVTPEHALHLIPRYLEAYEKQWEGSRYPSQLNVLFGILALGEDPGSALNLAKSLESEQYRQTAISSVVSAWGHDEARFRQLLNQVDDEEKRLNLMLGHLTRGGDPEKSLDALLKEVGDNPGQHARHYMAGMLAQIAIDDPEKALARLEGMENELMVSEIAETMAQQMVWADLENGLALVEKMENPVLRSKMLTRMVTSLSHHDPERAAELFEQLLMIPEAGGRAWNVGHNLAQKDPGKARAWVEGLPPGQTRRNAMGTVASESAAREPMETWEWLQQMPEGDARRSARTNALGAMIGEHTDLALTLFGQLTDPDEKKDALRNMMSKWAREDPDAAREYAARIPDEELRGEAVERIAGQMGYRRPEEGAKWIERLQGKEKALAVERFVQSWGNRNLEGAAAWVEGLSAGPARDVGLKQVARQVQRHDAEGAVIWASYISDEETRIREMSNYARQWLRKDEDAARGWIAKSNLPQEDKDKLLKKN